MHSFYTDDYKRVWGNQTINGDVEIIMGTNDELNIFTDTESYTLTLPPGKYHTEYTTNVSELINELNHQISISPLPIQALLGGYHKDQKYNIVVLQMTNGKEIVDLTGSFFDSFFA
ncbi:hypothetical protein AK95_13225 [Paenibacillus sp. LC231]|uniref:hypothetical protein n=1 Tax=Paenibacillus sp. LC231 TaxID=1120679 RepID=UPI0008DCA9F7|nr:hypothetical protein [Paenibacillus sp. LC231]OIB04571.1 hypothetical protein AK95_13225 [Paenibacillus sp. LC231]